ncbi:MAG: ABC transporter ATP-binding protein [Myxococcales bacterium]|nr:ABC transporter ATP-binding protein [Myxococcales bacterium]
MAEPPILEVIDLHKAFGAHQVLNGIDLRIETGRTTVIIGGSGSGKSVLIKHLVALLRPDSGEVRFHGQDLFQMDRAKLLDTRRHFGMLFQNAALFDSMDVYENVAFPLREHRHLPPSEEKDRVMEALAVLNLAGAERKFPGELSGGMKKRVALARATILSPEIIVYDEPTTGLDPVMIKQVDDMIAETAERMKVTSIVISHDMASTFRIAHHVAMLYQGQIVEYGTPAEFRASENRLVRDFIFVSGTGPLVVEPAAARPA